MKTVALIDEGLRSEAFYSDYFDRVKSESDADALTVIMSGPFLHAGVPATEEKTQRVEKLQRAGADMVIELPVYGVLLGLDSYAPALSMLLRKLGCVDELVLPYEAGNAELLEQICSMLMRVPANYRDALKQEKSRQPSRDEMTLAAVESIIPGGGAFLRRFMNRFAVELSNNMRLSYCPVRIRFLEVDWEEEATLITPEYDTFLGKKVMEKLETTTEEILVEIFGGREHLARQLLDLRGAGEMTFSQIADALTTPRWSMESMRQFLLRFLLDFRKIDHCVCALYSYVPLIRVIGLRSEVLGQELEKRAQSPLVWEIPQRHETSAGAMLLEFDERAAAYVLKTQVIW